MKYNKEIKVGLLAIATILILIFGINFLKGINLFQKGNDFYVEYSYIPGLMQGDAIEINGFPVGRVKEIGLTDENAGSIYVILHVTEPIRIPSDSKAVIKSADLLGDKFVQLQLGSSTQYLQSGDTISGGFEADITNQIREELRPLTEKVQSMIVSVDTAITVISGVFTPTFKDNFELSITNIKQTLETFNVAAKRIDELLQRNEPKIENIIDGISDGVTENETDIKNIIRNLSIITDSLAIINWGQMTVDLESSITNLNTVLEKMNSSDGTLGLMINDPELYYNLEQITETLSRISMEIESNPKKYVPPLIQIGGK